APKALIFNSVIFWMRYFRPELIKWITNLVILRTRITTLSRSIIVILRLRRAFYSTFRFLYIDYISRSITAHNGGTSSCSIRATRLRLSLGLLLSKSYRFIYFRQRHISQTNFIKLLITGQFL